MKSGALARSIGATIEESSGDVSVRLATSATSNMPRSTNSAASSRRMRSCRTRRGRSHSLVGGKQVFAARVNLPAIAMPERSYMRTSLAEMADDIRDELAATAIEAIRT